MMWTGQVMKMEAGYDRSCDEDGSWIMWTGHVMKMEAT